MKHFSTILGFVVLMYAVQARAQVPATYAQKLENNGHAWLLKGTEETLGRRKCDNGEYLQFITRPTTFLRRKCNTDTHTWDTTKGNWVLKVMPGNKLFITLDKVEYRAYVSEDFTTITLTLATQKRPGYRRDVVTEQHFVTQKNW